MPLRFALPVRELLAFLRSVAREPERGDAPRSMSPGRNYS